jgi:hypothetical protein
MTLPKIIVRTVAVLTLALVVPALSQAQAGRWVRDFYGHYFTMEDARRVASDLARSGQRAFYEDRPNAVTGTYGVYIERFEAEQAPAAAASAVSGQLTKSDALDRVRQGHHAKVYDVRLSPGRSYTIDLISPKGPGFFDTWLRIEDSRGNVLANDDDSGDGLNARIVFTPNREDTFRLVVTSYSKGATGNFTLSVR